MSQGKGSRKLRCDCALVFENAQSLGGHVKETGHMTLRFCAPCCHLFISKDGLQQHEKTAAKHKKEKAPILPLKKDASKNKPRADKSETAPRKLAVVTKPPKAAEGVKGKERTSKGPTKVNTNATRPPRNPPATGSTSKETISIQLSDALTKKYPWASNWEGPGIKALKKRCHDEVCLVSQGYYTGNRSHQMNLKYSIKGFVSTPVKASGVRRKAITLDCEMVGVAGGRDDLAQLCAVDLFTGEVLINTLVYPPEVVKDWRTKYSGVSPAKMAIARASGQALNGWPAARAKLFEFADADTVLVGHSLNNDLKVLHIAHKRIVDSAILVAEAVFGQGKRMLRKWGLKPLSRDLLGITIQSSRAGHDCLEDTLATRELVLWCLRERQKLDLWAKKAFIEYEEEKRKREERQRAKAKEEREKRRKEEEKERQQFPIKAVSIEGGHFDEYEEYEDDGYDSFDETVDWREYIHIPLGREIALSCPWSD
ncbi:ribonuclease H-like protein [Hypoxylon sp. FL1857]|nr:ribonuclease H-like protein [Hypoxylon sp. FL1857]